ncbi:hypothetical protein [Nannocystis sp. SCPEA4]|uniref:hypothetical protein n=1 Tax=Nannocystis sp. SCPEA4 TaxID=2996787 RepID=UPI002270BCA2|nr:hypothetical protein [Nannocystis sp. SCPEA4]MCY1057356.1 hypothetical protein [Nannocystis sp. SCPEA4]
MSDLVTAESPDGEWQFAHDVLRGPRGPVELPTMDFFERWTFARFCPGGQLILAFESGQPWSEYGSYGDRYGGFQIMAPTADPLRWAMVGLEFDYRSHDATFVPDDAVWHPRGVLAWLHDGCLFVQVLSHPRGELEFSTLPPRDSECELHRCFERWGDWRSLELDLAGQLLTARDAAGCDRYDLVDGLHARDDAGWEEL